MKTYIAVSIASVSIIIASFFFGSSIKSKFKKTNSISVKGLGTIDFESDLIVWKASFGKKSTSLKDAYARLEYDRKKIEAHLINKGISKKEMVYSSIEIRKDYKSVYDKKTEQSSSIFTGYKLTQSVTVESKKVNLVEDVSRKITELITSDIEINSYAPSYYYTKLADLKIKMIASATKDAKNRAKTIAVNAGANLGILKKATMGVFQITGRNSSDDYSWGGTYNTSSKLKTASITMRLEYLTE
ncbi:MAG: SIMPL domain-containing protein [Crocinitomicaceae bacterium]|nr:SIMPL domain-containing protein [Crocinitomicaceae bacterium]